MSDGEDTDSEDIPERETAFADDEQTGRDDPEEFETRLDDVAADVESAETEDDLDTVEAALDELEADLEAATFPEPEVEEPEDEDEEPEEPPDPEEELEDRISDIRDDIEEKRGPYVEDAADLVSQAESTVRSSEWTEEGEEEIAVAASEFADEVQETLPDAPDIDAEGPEAIADALAAVSETVAESGLDPDDDADAIAALLDAGEGLQSDLDDATVWSDLEVREQLRRQGFYDVLNPETNKHFPPELSAIMVYEANNEPEPILEALDTLGSDFMAENILSVLEHLAPPEAYDQVHGLAQRRNKQPVRILGRIGDDRATDTLVDFLGGGDVALEKVSLRSLGMIGDEAATEPVAQRLDADNGEVRSAAARALGLLGDTRAIDPLADVLADDEADTVRASAAWALTQIGTERALDRAAEYADDRSYLVQVEAEKAAGV